MLEPPATPVSDAAKRASLDEQHLPASDGGSIHCVCAGDGPTVVLSHGFLLDLTMYQPVFWRLVEQGYRVVAFDQRGHAGTRDGSAGCNVAAAVEDYRVLLSHFGSNGATLVGHSMGGFLSLLFCMRHPELAASLKRLVLLGANAGAVAEGSLPNRLQMPLVESGLMPKLWRIPGLGRALMTPLFGRDPEPEWLELTRKMITRQDVPRTLPLMRAMSLENHYGELHKVEVETRVLCGELDRTCPAWHSERLGRDIAHAQVRWLAGKGHMLGYEAPDAVLNAITGS